MHVRQATENDIPAIIPIADKEFGQGYLTESQLQAYISEPEQYLFKIAEDVNGMLEGFCISIIACPNEMGHYLQDAGAKQLFNGEEKIGIIKSVAITTKGRGTGTMLIRESMDVLKEQYHIRQFCSIGWKHPDGHINIEGVLKRSGFTAAKEIAGYWKEDSIKNNYSCPVCGHPCKCAAVIFIKTGDQ